MTKTLLKVLFIVLCPIATFAQEIESDLDSLMRMSAFTEESELQKVLNKNLTVSSAKALTTRETPGIISLVTAEEIRNSGARDMIDVLRLVPGFDVAQDLSFMIGIGLRGNWSNEGKVLVMLDGQPYNDLLYQGVALGNHFPVDAIERIEIIRGPGSAIYGGSAEYGVINIITKAADALNGIYVYGTAGVHNDVTGRTNGGVSLATKSDNLDWDISFFSGKGIVSDGLFTELYEDTVNVDLATSSYANPMNINAGLRVKDFKVRAMYDRFKTNDPYTNISFQNIFVDTRYDLKINDKVTLTPSLRYLNQIPWEYQSTIDSEDQFEVRAERYYGSLTLNYNVSRKINLNTGVIYFRDKATDLMESDYLLGGNTVEFNNQAIYAEGLFKHRLANATVGFRYERNNQYGDAFVPRIALTKKIENFHFKILYSQAFRAPSIENINLALDTVEIKPEKSGVVELELGYQFTPEMLLAVNAFTLDTKDVIVYTSTIDFPEGFYTNSDRTGSSGIEVLYSVRKKNWYTHLTYSLSKTNSNTTVESYKVPGINSQFVGLSAHKITINTNIEILPKLTVNPTLSWFGKRYAYTHVEGVDDDGDGAIDLDEDGEEIYSPVISTLDPYTLVNVFVNYQKLFGGLNIGFGVYDLLNERPAIPQAYNGDYAPIPGRSREYVIKLSYQLDFKK